MVLRQPEMSGLVTEQVLITYKYIHKYIHHMKHMQCYIKCCIVLFLVACLGHFLSPAIM